MRTIRIAALLHDLVAARGDWIAHLQEQMLQDAKEQLLPGEQLTKVVFTTDTAGNIDLDLDHLPPDTPVLILTGRAIEPPEPEPVSPDTTAAEALESLTQLLQTIAEFGSRLVDSLAVLVRELGPRLDAIGEALRSPTEPTEAPDPGVDTPGPTETNGKASD